MENIAEVVQRFEDERAGPGCGNEANTIDYGEADERRISVAMATEDVREGSDKEERAQRIPLCDAFK